MAGVAAAAPPGAARPSTRRRARAGPPLPAQGAVHGEPEPPGHPPGGEVPDEGGPAHHLDAVGEGVLDREACRPRQVPPAAHRRVRAEGDLRASAPVDGIRDQPGEGAAHLDDPLPAGVLEPLGPHPVEELPRLLLPVGRGDRGPAHHLGVGALLDDGCEVAGAHRAQRDDAVGEDGHHLGVPAGHDRHPAKRVCRAATQFPHRRARAGRRRTAYRRRVEPVRAAGRWAL